MWTSTRSKRSADLVINYATSEIPIYHKSTKTFRSRQSIKRKIATFFNVVDLIKLGPTFTNPALKFIYLFFF